MGFRELLRPRAQRPRPDHARLCGSGCRRSRCYSRTAYSKLVSSLVVIFSLSALSSQLDFRAGHCGACVRACCAEWKTGLPVLLSFHVHLFEDVLGSRGRDGCQWPIFFSGAVLFVAGTCVARTVGPERLAECHDRDSALAGHTLTGTAKWILAAGDGPGRSRQLPGYSATAERSGEDSGLKGFSCGAYPRSFRNNFED